MNSADLYLAFNGMEEAILERSESPASHRRHIWLKWGAAAACLCLIVAAIVGQSPETAINPNGDDLSLIRINWDHVAVNESERSLSDGALRCFDSDIYIEETWKTAEVAAYYGWKLTPSYIPEGLSADSQTLSARIVRERSTGLFVLDHAGRGYWSDYWEDGSPKSDDDLYVPTGFTISASKLGLYRCSLLPVDDAKTTDFGGTAVTLKHCAMPYGPFDPTQKAPNGLYNLPAGYYDVYTASFHWNGAEYEVYAQRLELEEVIRIVASILNTSADENFSVGIASPMG